MQALKLAVLSLLVNSSLTAAPLPLIAVGAEKSKTEASISYQLNTVGSTFLSSDKIALSFELTIAPEDIGSQSELYLVAITGQKSYIRLADKTWQAWTTEQALIATKTLTLQAKEHLEVLQDHSLPAGEYQIFAAYKTQAKQVKYTKNSTTLVVFDAQQQALHAITQAEILRDYLYQGALNSPRYSGCGSFGDVCLWMADFSSGAVVSAEPSATKVSSTTLQETGVDEADRMKTDQDLLFSLRSCAADSRESCVYSYRLQASPAQATELAFLKLSESEENQSVHATARLGELYLRPATEARPRSLLWLDTSSSGQVSSNLYPNWQSSDSQITLKFIQADDPENLIQTQQISLEGELLSSRLVDGVLYLLSRSSREYYVPYNTQELLTKPPLEYFLPHYQSSDSVSRKALVDSSQCYIAPQNSSRYNAAVLSVVTAIPVNNPSAMQSRCIAGELNTFYASPKALYFATSRYPQSFANNQLVYDFAAEQVTDIHKFSLQDSDLDYRGSGQVTGHLGWEKDKQSFRFGEYNNRLRVATSEGSSWGMDSRTKITVLVEDSENHQLTEISALENLGKPGERLYAARFIGEKAYLVTFRQTDPLIVIDFSQPEKPVVMGELEIDGYSDYLQPLGKDYLLGVGKDAATDERDSTWYQGVKVSLFDVSSAENLGLVNSIVLGKRGTDATVLQDHHGLTLLQTAAERYSVALPIALHDSALSTSVIATHFSPLSTYYDWTETGLYMFDITTGEEASLTQSAKLIAESQAEGGSFRYYDLHSDRAVIQDQSVHYIHGEQVLSAEIADLK
ncbi:MAG: hypothetical protein GQ582_01545 [Methyloprofundus sp.]|nr:hypothetical protein [Methyloprofundus sp.]